MRVDHIAIWSDDIERLRDFYVSYFEAVSNDGYKNKETGFSSYFLTFSEGARLELMNKRILKTRANKLEMYVGYCHLAICVENAIEVQKITERIKKDGYQVLSEPRTTGDGYYESVILDPDGNHIEITC